ncbi:DUF418 domain-containing protein [Paenibacillus dokdonensis]|uniref:DUF418 domain-containing protein n=1 Tax=Paenibacillus dokdonensis TaxID=2567944 RepID=A0ABU6GSI4_9BACL|nr:DUF418 domain-containing protein [Paenibacillus dokdonensis]MEC0242383.1 DUF418 domain-containing protein [Paenibacillus dokdonensis]
MKRIDVLDYLRGFALIGIVFINIFQMVPYIHVPPEYGIWSGMEQAVLKFINYAVFERFYTIFSFLFGIGFYLFISRARARGDRAYLLFTRRLLILLIFGFIHHQFQPGEALTVYAILGFLLLPLYQLKPTINLALGLILLVSNVWLGSIGMSLSMFILGLWAGQCEIFEHVAQYKKRWIFVQVVSLILIPLGLWAQNEIINRTGLLDAGMAAGGLAEDVFYVTTLTLLLQYPCMQKWLIPMSKLGRMALTNYIMQTVLILTMDAVLYLSNHAYYLILAMIATEILMFQMIFSVMWLNRFAMGPLEWIWRIGTYGKIPDHYKQTTNESKKMSL